MAELLGKTESLEHVQPALLPAHQPASPKEPSHGCKGEGRCCGGCRNPKRPVASGIEEASSGSLQESVAELLDKPSV